MLFEEYRGNKVNVAPRGLVPTTAGEAFREKDARILAESEAPITEHSPQRKSQKFLSVSMSVI